MIIVIVVVPPRVMMLCTPIGVHANETDGTRASNPTATARLLPIVHTIMVALMKMRRRPLFNYDRMGRGHQVLEGGGGGRRAADGNDIQTDNGKRRER